MATTGIRSKKVGAPILHATHYYTGDTFLIDGGY